MSRECHKGRCCRLQSLSHGIEIPQHGTHKKQVYCVLSLERKDGRVVCKGRSKSPSSRLRAPSNNQTQSRSVPLLGRMYLIREYGLSVLSEVPFTSRDYYRTIHVNGKRGIQGGQKH